MVVAISPHLNRTKLRRDAPQTHQDTVTLLSGVGTHGRGLLSLQRGAAVATPRLHPYGVIPVPRKNTKATEAQAVPRCLKPVKIPHSQTHTIALHSWAILVRWRENQMLCLGGVGWGDRESGRSQQALTHWDPHAACQALHSPPESQVQGAWD